MVDVDIERLAWWSTLVHLKWKNNMHSNQDGSIVLYHHPMCWTVYYMQPAMEWHYWNWVLWINTTVYLGRLTEYHSFTSSPNMLNLFCCKTPHKGKNMYTQQQPVRAQHEAKNGPKKLYMKEITLKNSNHFFSQRLQSEIFSCQYWHHTLLAPGMVWKNHALVWKHT